MKIFKHSSYPFYYSPPLYPPFLLQPASLPTLLINHIFSWKSKLEHTGLDITCRFFQDAKSSLTKYKNCFWKRLMELVKHLSWSFLQKKLMAYRRKQFPKKIPH